MTKYNGHKNWQQWNVSLWINNDEGLYRTALYFISEHKQYGKDYAAEKMLECLHADGITKKLRMAQNIAKRRSVRRWLECKW